MRKLLVFLLGIMVMATMVAGCGGDKKDAKKPAAQKFINIATGGTAGTYFPLGGALADILNKNIAGCNASAQSTGASVANVNLLNQGKVDIAFIQNDIAFYAAIGEDELDVAEVKNHILDLTSGEAQNATAEPEKKTSKPGVSESKGNDDITESSGG